jgi:two-component system sensor histidine kinase YesM
MLGKEFTDSWVNGILDKKNGTDTININGTNMIVCFNTSTVTNWISVAVFPSDKLVETMIPVIRSYTTNIAIILTLISILVASFISIKITNPLSKLIKAIKRTGEGDFNLKLKEEGSKESKELIKRYNVMNEKIQKLIEDNYEITIKEKEAEITALNLQLDPHFMYNTLNLISLISMENGQDEISDMLISMSTMLKYSVKKRDTLVSFKEDMDYLKSYIFIMTKRFEGKFYVEYDINPKLYDYKVPKFLLQPFVENSLIHGFDKQKRVGKLIIKCWIDNNTRYFSIQDNGKGMTTEKLSELLCSENESIGVSNINNRIKIVYGNEYGIDIKSILNKGTTTTISMPL